MVELEQLTPFRFYKLKAKFTERCKKIFFSNNESRPCNGLLRLFRNDGTITQRCNHVDCFEEYIIPRFCTNCGAPYRFEETSCENCEPLVIQAAQYYLSIEESDKAIKKINKTYKSGHINQEEWKNAIQLNKEEKVSCENKLKKLKEENPVIENHLATLII